MPERCERVAIEEMKAAGTLDRRVASLLAMTSAVRARMGWAYQTMRGKKGDAAIEAAMRFYLRLLIAFVGIYF